MCVVVHTQQFLEFTPTFFVTCESRSILYLLLVKVGVYYICYIDRGSIQWVRMIEPHLPSQVKRICSLLTIFHTNLASTTNKNSSNVTIMNTTRGSLHQQ